MSQPSSATEPAPDPGTRPPVPPGRVRLLAVARPVLTVTAFVVAYYLLPVDRQLSGWTLVGLFGGLCLVVVIIVWQIRVILSSPYPTLQGVQALALSAPLYLLIYANVYYVLALNVPDSFTEPLTRTDSLYFALTVFSTVGFGDITPVSQGARVLVVGQMVGNLLVIGVALRVVLTAVQHGRQHSAEQWHHGIGG